MNDFSWLTDLISSVGFPIFVTLYLLWQGNKEEQTHREEVKELSTALNNNTLVLQKIVDKMDDMKEIKLKAGDKNDRL